MFISFSKPIRTISRLVVVLVFFLLSPVLLAADIFVLPDRNPVGMGEEFTLTFSTTEEPDGSPDFSPLYEDFDVVGTSASNNLRIINGAVSKELSWRVRLYPKASGTLPIPSIQFGSASSPVSQITIDENTAADAIPRDSVLVELEVDTPEPYVQQQFIVTQRMLHSIGLEPNRASMSHPEVSEGKALVKQLGKLVHRTLNRKGIQYKVSERRYAVFPQTSGELTFKPTIFQGVVITPGVQRRNIPFGMMSGRQIRRFSEALTLNVKGQPGGVQGTWLPAKSLSLNVYWETQPEQFKTGEPVTLTIAVIADGLMAEQLPEIKLALPKGIKGYSNQPELRNDDQGVSLIGTRQERWILIGTAPGEYILPAFNLEWWNLDTGKAESAFVEATNITVTGEVSASTETEIEANINAGVSDNAGPVGEAGNDSDAASQALLAEQDEEAEAADAPEKENSYWLWLLAIGVLLLILLGILYKRRAGEKSPEAEQPYQAPIVNYYDQLERGCRSNDAQKTHDALAGWVRQDLQLNPPTLAQLRQEVAMPFRQAIDDLSMVLYAKQTGEWRGAELWEAVQGFQRDKQVVKNKASHDLLNLYPD